MSCSEEASPWGFGYKFVCCALFLSLHLAGAAEKPTCLNPAANLDGWYDLDSQAGPTASVAGFGPDAIWFGNPTPIEGRFGGALQFGPGYLELASREAFNYPTQDFTVSVWIKTTASATLFLDKRCPAGGAGCGPTTEGWALGVSPTGYLQMLLGSASPYFYEGFTAFRLNRINDGEWHFVAASVNRRAGELRFAVDDAEPQLISLEGYRGAIPSPRPLRIGADHGHGPKFAGALDELQIHARALEPAEVTAIAISGPQCRPPACSPASAAPTLVAWYAFDEKAGSIWSDFAGENHYLSSVTGPPAGRAAGVAAGAVTFEAVPAGGGLRAPLDAPGLELGVTPMTVAVWIRYAPGINGRRAIIDLPGSYTLLLEDGTLRLELGSGDAWLSLPNDSPPRLDDGQWHHLALVMGPPTSSVTAPILYVDAQTRPMQSGLAVPPRVSGPLHVGAFAAEDSPTFGALDELAIFRHALPADQVRTLVDAAASSFCRRNDRGCVAPPAALVSWYRFDQPGGIFDDAGQAPNEPFLLSSTSLRAAGRVGAGLRFTASMAFGRTLGVTAKLNFDSAFTLSFWIRPAAGPGQRTILEKMSYSGAQAEQGYRLRLLNGKLELGLANQTFTATNSLAIEQWQHVALLIAPNAAPVLFINGVAAPLNSSQPFTGRATSGNPLLIGASAQASLNAGDLAGFDFDELSFYRRLLTNPELEALSQSDAGQCLRGDALPTKPVFEVRTDPENIGAMVGVSGEPATANVYATTTAPSAVTVAPATLSLNSGTEYRFRNWSFNGSPNPAWTSLAQAVPESVASAIYTATYDVYHRLTVTTTGDCAVTPIAGFYLAGTSVPFQVTLPTGGLLVSVTFSLGAATPIVNGSSLQISGPATLEVNCRGAFVPFTVSASPANLGLQLIVDGATFSNSQTFSWVTGSPRVLHVLALNQFVASAQYTFRRWRNATANTTLGTTSPLTVTPTAPAHYVAEFDRTGVLVQLRQPVGCQIVLSPPLPANSFYPPGTRLTITLSPNPGFGAVSLTIIPAPPAVPITGRSPIEYTLEGPVSISGLCSTPESIVRFVSSSALDALLNISYLPVEGGAPIRVQGLAPSVPVRPGGTLTLTAAATASNGAQLFRFTNITPGNYSSLATFPTPSESTTYVAHYERHCDIANFIIAPSAGGQVFINRVSGERPYASVDCYTPGSVLSLTAQPSPGYQFVQWLGTSAATSANPLTFTVGSRPFPGAQFRTAN